MELCGGGGAVWGWSCVGEGGVEEGAGPGDHLNSSDRHAATKKREAFCSHVYQVGGYKAHATMYSNCTVQAVSQDDDYTVYMKRVGLLIGQSHEVETILYLFFRSIGSDLKVCYLILI